MLVSVLATAIYFTLQKPFSARYGAEAATTVTFFGGTLGTLPFGVGLPHALLTAPHARIGALVWLGLAPTFLGYLTWNMALHRASVSKVSSFIYFSTPIALLISWAWLGERPGWMTLIGAAIVVGGRGPDQHAQRAEAEGQRRATGVRVLKTVPGTRQGARPRRRRGRRYGSAAPGRVP